VAFVLLVFLILAEGREALWQRSFFARAIDSIVCPAEEIVDRRTKDSEDAYCEADHDASDQDILEHRGSTSCSV
jgi:hypothetical protein